MMTPDNVTQAQARARAADHALAEGIISGVRGYAVTLNEGHAAAAAITAHRLAFAKEATPSASVERVQQFADAANAIPWVAEKLARGQQFNAYERSTNDEDDPDDEKEFYVGIGPISDFRFVADVTGTAEAQLLESAFKLAALTLPVPSAPQGGEA